MSCSTSVERDSWRICMFDCSLCFASIQSSFCLISCNGSGSVKSIDVFKMVRCLREGSEAVFLAGVSKLWVSLSAHKLTLNRSASSATRATRPKAQALRERWFLQLRFLSRSRVSPLWKQTLDSKSFLPSFPAQPSAADASE